MSSWRYMDHEPAVTRREVAGEFARYAAGFLAAITAALLLVGLVCGAIYGIARMLHWSAMQVFDVSSDTAFNWLFFGAVGIGVVVTAVLMAVALYRDLRDAWRYCAREVANKKRARAALAAAEGGEETS